MRCLCPKCGKATDMRPSELRTQKGAVVCPRCLTVFYVTIPKGEDSDSGTPPPVPKRRQAQADKAAAVSKRVNRSTSSAGRSHTASDGNLKKMRLNSSSNSNSKPKKNSSKVPSPKSSRKPMGTLGCALNVALAMLIFFVFYFLIGNLM